MANLVVLSIIFRILVVSRTKRYGNLGTERRGTERRGTERPGNLGTKRAQESSFPRSNRRSTALSRLDLVKWSTKERVLWY